MKITALAAFISLCAAASPLAHETPDADIRAILSERLGTPNARSVQSSRNVWYTQDGRRIFRGAAGCWGSYWFFEDGTPVPVELVIRRVRGLPV